MESAKACWILTVKDEFSSAHALRHYRGKCEAPHGHNFSVELRVKGNTLTEGTELLADFKDIKKALKAVLERLDHKDLNFCPPFDKINPSSENLARFIYRQAKAELAADPACAGTRVYSVTVSERSPQSATYMEEE